MFTNMLFGTVGGLGMFLFGMRLMSDGLKKVAGQKLKNLLGALTRRRVVAVLVGAMVTALIQSSSATTVMTVGFVNAGLLTLKQALSVVLGANIGTTFTAWLVSTFGIGAFKITAYALPAVGVGFLLTVIGKTQKVKSIGNIVLGFGLLFIGISFMKEGFEPLRDSQKVQAALIWLGRNPILAVLAGTALTMLLQSSSASIMIIQVLAFQGAFGTDWDLALRVAIPFVLGDNIGTTITAQLASLQTSRNARRAAMGHTIFNVIGVLYMYPLVQLGWFGDMVEFITPLKLSQSFIMAYIAVAHSVFNIFNALLFLPLIKWLEIIVIKLIPIREEEARQKPVVLERHLLSTPVIAMDQARREIVRMSKVSADAVNQAIEGLDEDDPRKLAMVRKTEDLIDDFQYQITAYVAELSTREISAQLSIELPVFLHTVNDLERVGDHAVNIAEIADRKIERGLGFSAPAKAEAAKLKEQVNQMLDCISDALENNNIEKARAALVNENNLNRMQVELRRNHVRRMSERVCTPEAGLIFIDLVDNVEKIGDHLTNIAQAVIGGLQWDGVDANALSGEYKAVKPD